MAVFVGEYHVSLLVAYASSTCFMRKVGPGYAKPCRSVKNLMPFLLGGLAQFFVHHVRVRFVLVNPLKPKAEGIVH